MTVHTELTWIQQPCFLLYSEHAVCNTYKSTAFPLFLASTSLFRNCLKVAK